MSRPSGKRGQRGSQETTNRSFDDLARALAECSISRRRALRLFAGSAIAAMIPSRALADDEGCVHICHVPFDRATGRCFYGQRENRCVSRSRLEEHRNHPCDCLHKRCRSCTRPTTTTSTTSTSTTSTTTPPVRHETICSCQDRSISLGCDIDCLTAKPIADCEIVCGVGNVPAVECLRVPPGIY